MRHAKNAMIEENLLPSLDDVAVFVTVASQHSFVQAARRLRMPTSTVSRSVARLEEALATRLLQRTSRSVALTDEGRALVARAAGHLEGLAAALSATAEERSEITGRLRVTAPAFTGSTRVAAALAGFAAAHPAVTVELDVSNTLRDLLEDGYDFGIRVGPTVDADFIAKKLWTGSFGIFATKSCADRLFGQRKRVRRADLERGPCVVMRTSTTWRFRDRAGALVQVNPAKSFVLNDPRGVAEVARRGVGIAQLPLELAADMPELERLSTELGEPEPLELFAVYPSKRLLPLRVRAALDWLARA